MRCMHVRGLIHVGISENISELNVLEKLEAEAGHIITLFNVKVKFVQRMDRTMRSRVSESEGRPSTPVKATPTRRSESDGDAGLELQERGGMPGVQAGGQGVGDLH